MEDLNSSEGRTTCLSVNIRAKFHDINHVQHEKCFNNFRIKNSIIISATKKMVPILKKIESYLKPRFQNLEKNLPKK